MSIIFFIVSFENNCITNVMEYFDFQDTQIINIISICISLISVATKTLVCSVRCN